MCGERAREGSVQRVEASLTVTALTMGRRGGRNAFRVMVTRVRRETALGHHEWRVWVKEKVTKRGHETTMGSSSDTVTPSTTSTTRTLVRH